MQSLRNNNPKVKQVPEKQNHLQTLPSPREHNKTDNPINPTVNLLPYYFVGENLVYKEALKEYNKMVKYNSFKKQSKMLHVVDTHAFLEHKNGGKFSNTRSNKTQGNSPDRDSFVSKLSKSKSPGRFPGRRRDANQRASVGLSNLGREKGISHKKLTEDNFKTIVQAAKTRIGWNATKKAFTLLTHMSELRMEPMWQYKAEDVIETLKRGVTVLKLKFDEYCAKN